MESSRSHTSPAGPSPSLAQLINRVSRALARQGDETLKPLGLRYAQTPVVAILRMSGRPMTQKDLATAVGIEQPSMAQLLARMDRDGLIQHAPHPTDARSRTISLADPDDPRIAEAVQRLNALEEQAVTGLTEKELRTLKGLLARVGQNLEQAPEGS